MSQPPPLTAILRRAGRETRPWKNGGGTTTEIACAPPGAGLDDFSWRVSTAEVALEGPFSGFPGVERVLVIISGAGLVLSVDGADHRLAPLEPFELSGDADSSASVPDGPVRDLNFMARRNLTSAEVEVLHVGAGARLPVASREDLIVVAVSGAPSLRAEHPPSAPPAGAEPLAWTLETLDAVHCRGPGALLISGPATVVLGRFTPTSSGAGWHPGQAPAGRRPPEGSIGGGT